MIVLVAWCLAGLALAWGLSRLMRADARGELDSEPQPSAPMGEADVTPTADDEAFHKAVGCTVLIGVRAVASDRGVFAIPRGSCIVVVQDQVFHRLIKPALDKHFAQMPRDGDDE